MNKSPVFLTLDNHSPYRWVILASGFTILVVTIGSFYSFGVFLTALLDEFGWTRASISGAFSLATICMGSMAIPIGWLTDRYGPRRVMVISGVILGVGYILVSTVTQPWHLLLVYGVIIGGAMGAPYVVQATTISRWFVRRRGMALGIIGAGIGLGTVIIPPAASQLLEAFHWRQGFIIFGAGLLVVTLLASLLLKRAPRQAASTADSPTATTSGLGDGAILRLPQFWLINLTFMVTGACIFMSIVHLVPHTVALGIDETVAATVMSLVGGIIVVSRFGMGYITDRRGSRFVLFLGLLAMVIAYTLLLYVSNLQGMYLVAIVYGFAYGACLIAQPTIVAEYFGMRSYGWVFGASELCVLVGGASGPLLAGYIFDLTGNYRLGFICAIGLAVSGLVLTLLMGRPCSRGKLSQGDTEF